MSPSLAIAMRPRDNWQQKRADKDRALIYQAEVARQMKAEADARDLQVSQMQETLSTVSRLGFLKKDEETLKAWNTKKQDDLTKHISEKYSGDVNKFLAIEGDRWKAAYVRELADNPDYASGLKNKTNYGLYQDAQTKSGLVIRPVQYNRLNEESGKYELVQGTIEQNLIDYQSGKAKDIGWNATFEAPKDAKKFFNTNQAPDLSKDVTPNDLVQYGMSAGLNQQDATLWAQQAMKNDKWLWKNGEWDRNLKLAQFQQKAEMDNRNAAMRQQAINLQKQNNDIARQKLKILERSMQTQDPIPYLEGVDLKDENKSQTVFTAAGETKMYNIPRGGSAWEYAKTRFNVQDIDQEGESPNKKMLPLSAGQSIYVMKEVDGKQVMEQVQYNPNDSKTKKLFGGVTAMGGAGVYIAPSIGVFRMEAERDIPVPYSLTDEYQKVSVGEDYVGFTTENGKRFYVPYSADGLSSITDAKDLKLTKAEKEAVQGMQEQETFSNFDALFGY